METLQPDDPRELGSYRLLRRLGAGGMGRVYLARSPGGRTVAVKVVRPDLAADADFRGRFRHEVEIARAVSGRYTAPVVDADPDAPLPWLATSYVLGPDLTDVVDAHGALPERTVHALAAGLAAALQEIHAAGLIHRDLKPSNVLLAADGPRVIDFGIARAVDGNRMTQTGVVVGSPGYMPPEQALGQDVGPAGDVFSLGAVLAFAATGRSAFGDRSSHAALLYQVVHGEPELTGVPQSLLGLVRACLLKDPAGRPAPAEIVTALAPQGVEGVLRDWLPSAVASTIATHAAGILDLEAPEAAEAAEAARGVQGAGPAGAPGARGGAPGAAAFGSAPVMPGGTPSVSGYGTPPGGMPAPGSGYGTSAPGYGGTSAAGYGTSPGGTPAPGPAYRTPAPGYGTPPGGSPTPGPAGYGYPPAGTHPAPTPHPGHGGPGTPLPGTVHLGAQGGAAAGPAPSRRRVLGLALGGAAVVAAGGGAAWWLASADDTPGSATDTGGKGGSAAPAGENFTTPPAGVAPQPLWHKSVAEDSTDTDVPLLTHDGLLLISGDPLVAYDVKTGRARWSKKGICRPGARLLFHGGKVFLADGDYDGVLVAHDVRTGDEAWRSRLGKDLSIEDTIAIDARNVYVTLTDYSQSKSATKYRTAVAAVSHTTGKTVWLQRRDWGTKDYDVQGSVAGNYLVYADSNYNLTVRNTAGGAQLWSKKIGDDWTWRPTVANGMVFLPGDKLTAVDADTGKNVWTLSPNGRGGFANPTVIDGVLYTSDNDDGVWAVNVRTGKRIWLCDDLDVEGPETFLKAGTTLYGATGSLDGGIVALGAKTGRLRWTYTDSKAAGEPWQVALSGNRLMATHGPEIYALPAV